MRGVKARFDLVVFDLAGTSVQDRGEAPAAFERALSEFGVAVTAEQISAVRGASKREALRHLLGPSRSALAAPAYARFVELANAAYADARAIDGAEGVFASLREDGLLLALNTGFERAIVDPLIKRLGWPRDWFAAIVCGDEVAAGRPAPDLIFAAMTRAGVQDAHRVVNVGDTMLDLRAGHAAGVGANVGVLSGAHARAQLAGEPHTHIIASIREVRAALACA